MGETRITGYGPNASDARVAEIRRCFAAWGARLECLALAAREGGVVLHGRCVWMEPLRKAGLRLICCEQILASLEQPCFALALVDGVELAAVLTRLGREGDAAKVTGGPPDQPAPTGARLLVCLVDEICVAVTWSQGTPVGAGAMFFDARRML